MTAASPEDVTPQVMAAFQQFDRDGNGLIDSSELAAVLQKLNAAAFDAAACEVMFEAADVDKNGKIDLKEFIDWLFYDPKAQEMLDALDKDRMSRMGALLLSIDLPWMKEHVDKSAFIHAISALTRQDSADSSFFCVAAKSNTLPAAHALMSVDAWAVPEQANIEPQPTEKGDEILGDEVGAPLVYAALATGCKNISVARAEWGDRMVMAFAKALPSSLIERLSLSFAGIQDEAVVVRIMAAIDASAVLHTVDLSNNKVGLDGLHAVHAAVKLCPSLRNVYLYNIGPWTDGDGLGCRREPEDEDVRMLQALHDTIKERCGCIQNEAFNEGDMCNYGTKEEEEES